MYCIKCGTKLIDTAVFCSQCGTPVNNAMGHRTNSPSNTNSYINSYNTMYNKSIDIAAILGVLTTILVGIGVFLPVLTIDLFFKKDTMSLYSLWSYGHRIYDTFGRAKELDEIFSTLILMSIGYFVSAICGLRTMVLCLIGKTDEIRSIVKNTIIVGIVADIILLIFTWADDGMASNTLLWIKLVIEFIACFVVASGSSSRNT